MAGSAGSREVKAIVQGKDDEGQPIFSLLVKRTYDIRPGGRVVRAEKPRSFANIDEYYDDGDPAWTTVKHENELAPFKLATDVVVIGKAYAPGGKPVPELDVTVEVAAFRKTLRVTGDRHCIYRRNASPGFSEPVGFTEMSVRYDRAYGGRDRLSNPNEPFYYPRNNLGLGVILKNRKETLEGLPLPNIEDPGDLLTADRVVIEGLAERFEYDVTGNLTRNGIEGNNGVVTYDLGDRLVSKGHTRYEHDAHGRLVRKIEQADSATPGIWTYQWDALDQLRAVTRPNGQTWEYLYDAFSRRVLKRGPKEEVRFVWSAHVPVQEKSSKHDHWSAHLFSQNSFVPLAQVQDRKFYPILTDHIGTPQEMANQVGEVIWRFRGKAFGEPDPDSDQALQCLFRFQGQYYDSESGLHYNRFRYYDCSLGRYISADPIGIEAGQNLYVYGPNPIAWVDPLGLAKECGKLSDPNPIPVQIRKEYEEIKLGRGTPRISPAGGQTIFQAWDMAGRRDVDQWRGSREWDVPGTSHRILQRPDNKLGYVLNHDYSSPFLFPAPWYPEGGTVPKKLGGR